MPIIISVSQALLLLIDKYQDNLQKLDILKRLYLSGVQNDEEAALIKELMQDDNLREYTISYNYKVIDEDPTRRYFETHLAFETLNTSLQEIDIQTLRDHYNSLYKMTETVVDDPLEKSDIDSILNGTTPPNSDLFNKEYADAVRNIQSGQAYEKFSDEEKEKLSLLIKAAFLAIINVFYDYLPIPIYGKGIFSDKQRGRLRRDESQENVASHNLGILKSYMPLPRDDLSLVDTASSYLRPADQFSLNNPNSVWAIDNFNRLVHPFSGSISGTMLSQLRVFKYLHTKGKLVFNDKNTFSNFIKNFSSAMLYNAGGHTFHEFLFPLLVPEVQASFSFIHDFNDLNMNTLLFKNNEFAFEKAIKDTIEYNKTILARKSLQEVIKLTSPIREIKKLQNECNKYKNYLEDQIRKGLKHDPDTYKRYALSYMNESTRNDDFNFNALACNISTIKKDKIMPEAEILLIEKYKIVKNLYELLSKPALSISKAVEFKENFEKNRAILEENRNSAGNNFKKAVYIVLQFFGLKQSKGKKFTEKVPKNYATLFNGEKNLAKEKAQLLHVVSREHSARGPSLL